jgi:mannose-6-phosphate isomerase-like protein (cupin superfamily)
MAGDAAPAVTALSAVIAGLGDRPAAYGELLRVPAMSAGIYRVRAGAADPQQPHREDEVYYVVSGAGRIRIGDGDHVVAAGDVAFVPAGVVHRFHDVTEDLTLLVVFAPAET